MGARRYASEATKAGGMGAVGGGLVGGGAVLAVLYGYYHFSGVKTAVQTAQSAKGYVDDALNKFKLQLPDTPSNANDALSILKDTATKYAAFIPGGRGYVDSAFKDVEAIRKNHGSEVDKIVQDAYNDVRKISSEGVSLDSAGKVFDVLANHLTRLYDVAGDAAEDILENHPELKEKYGSSKEQIQKFSEQYRGEATKQLKEVRGQVQDIFKTGLDWQAVGKIQQLVEDLIEKGKKAGNEVSKQANEKGGEALKQAKQQGSEALNSAKQQGESLLSSSPQIKKFLEENSDALKNVSISEVLEKVQEAASSGDIKPLEEYVKK
jgi:F0F1-type ATP synthase membrane subunit b/b'